MPKMTQEEFAAALAEIAKLQAAGVDVFKVADAAKTVKKALPKAPAANAFVVEPATLQSKGNGPARVGWAIKRYDRFKAHLTKDEITVLARAAGLIA